MVLASKRGRSLHTLGALDRRSRGGAPGVSARAKTQLESGGGFALPLLADAAFFEITITVTVDATSGSVANTATVDPPAGTVDPTPGNNSATKTDPVTPVADLAITKTNGVSSVDAGSSTTYTVRVTNNGPSAVTGAILKDPVATGLAKTATACSSATSNQCSTAPTAVELESGSGFALPLLADGDFFEITITATVTAPYGTVANTAVTDPPVGTIDPDPTDNTATDTDSVVPLELVANFVLLKRNIFAVVQPGGTTVYTISVTNEGPSTVSGATLRDPLMPGLIKTGVDCARVGGNQCVTAPSIAALQGVDGADLPTLAAGQFYEVTVTTTVDATSGTVTNTATVTLPPGVIDPTPDNHTDTVVTPVVPDPSDLAFTGSSSSVLALVALLLLGAGAVLAGPARPRRRRR